MRHKKSGELFPNGRPARLVTCATGAGDVDGGGGEVREEGQTLRTDLPTMTLCLQKCFGESHT